VNRALVSVRTIVTRKGGKMGSVAYNFNYLGVIDFKGDNRQDVEDNLVLGDVDVKSVTLEDGEIEVYVAPDNLEKAKDVLKGMGVTEFDSAETTLVANDYVTLGDDDLQKFKDMMAELDESEDVQAVYHNVENA
jgi:transcriptional/translational regulatory protein YebC/TACO1